MKKIIGYAGGVLAICALFCMCYYASYKTALKEFNQRAREQESNIYTELARISEENKTMLSEIAKKTAELEAANKLSEEAAQVAEVVLAPRNTVLPEVNYLEETYNAATGRLESHHKTAPGFLIGMTREELQAYLAQYMDNLSLAEYEAGLQNYEIVSFSESKVVLRKTYDITKVPYKYYVNITDGMVTVYYSDLESVFEYTHIPAAELSEENLMELMQGIYVKDREELYSILEGFSS